MRKNLIPDLNEITFEGRNKEYGAYLIRKKYTRYLVFSFILAIIILGIFVLTPWLFYYFGPEEVFSDEMYAVEYSFIPPPEDMPYIPEIAPPMSNPEEVVHKPVIVDSVTEEQPVQQEPEEQTSDEQHDSISNEGNSGGNGTEGEGTGGKIYTVIDSYPKYPGGDQARLNFLRMNIKYPESAMKEMIQGVVKIIFVVEPDGSLSRFEVVKGIGGGCDEEALRVARMMPRWEPGRRNGQNVRVMISMPIVFRLPRKPGT